MGRILNWLMESSVKKRHFTPRNARLKVCREVAARGGNTAEAVAALGYTVKPGALRRWLKTHDPETLYKLKYKFYAGPQLSEKQAEARISICERIADEGGNLSDAASAMDTITPNGLYYWLGKYAPTTLRRLCRPKGGAGCNLQIGPEETALRIRLIEELGYAKAARRLKMPERSGREALYGWLRYRKKLGLYPVTDSPRSSV